MYKIIILYILKNYKDNFLANFKMSNPSFPNSNTNIIISNSNYKKKYHKYIDRVFSDNNMSFNDKAENIIYILDRYKENLDKYRDLFIGCNNEELYKFIEKILYIRSHNKFFDIKEKSQKSITEDELYILLDRYIKLGLSRNNLALYMKSAIETGEISNNIHIELPGSWSNQDENENVPIVISSLSDISKIKSPILKKKAYLEWIQNNTIDILLLVKNIEYITYSDIFNLYREDKLHPTNLIQLMSKLPYIWLDLIWKGDYDLADYVSGIGKIVITKDIINEKQLYNMTSKEIDYISKQLNILKNNPNDWLELFSSNGSIWSDNKYSSTRKELRKMIS